MKYVFTITTPVLIFTVYLLTNLYIPFHFEGKMIFLMDAILWAITIPITLLICKLTRTQVLRTDKTLIQIAAITATFQFSLSVFMAFFMGFGKNPTVWTPKTLTIYFPFLLTPFLAIEISRAYLAQTTKHKPTMTILLISLFYTLITPSIPQYLGLTTPFAVTEFLIRTLIPTLATSLLATYLAYLGGLPANLTYMAVPAFFTWFSPILPNIQWQTQSILTVIAATIGFLILDAAVKPLPTAKERRFPRIRLTRKGEKQAIYWTAIALIAVIAVWSTTGLLGFTPTVIASGSMQPTLNVGDIAITVKTPTKAIKIGDIIQFYRASGEPPTIHRVIDKYEGGGLTWFITKGDANNAPDDPINEHQVIGKVILIIPKLGWISITLKNIAIEAYTLLTNLPQIISSKITWIATRGLYITLALVLAAYSYLFITLKDMGGKKK